MFKNDRCYRKGERLLKFKSKKMHAEYGYNMCGVVNFVWYEPKISGISDTILYNNKTNNSVEDTNTWLEDDDDGVQKWAWGKNEHQRSRSCLLCSSLHNLCCQSFVGDNGFFIQLQQRHRIWLK